MPGAGPTRVPLPLRDPAPRHRGATSAWLAVAAWAALIWWLGSGTFGAPTTSRFLYPLITWLWPDSSFEQRFAVLLAIRKLAHPTVYGVLAALALRAFRRSGLTKALPSMAAAFAFALALAGLDELRQASLTSRTGSLLDVGLDACGALAAVVLYNGLASGRGMKKSSK